MSVKEMPLPDFLRTISAQYGVSVLWSDGMDKRLVSVEADGVPLDEIFTGLSRRFGVAVERVGSSWYVGEVRDEDKIHFVRKASRLKKENLQDAVAVVLGDGGRSRVFDDGLIIAYDRPGALRRLGETLDAIENARSDSWVLQLYLFSTSKAATKELGFDTEALIDLSYTFAQGSLVPASVKGFNLAGQFSAVMKAAATREDVRLIGKPLFVLADGETSTFTSGLAVPIAKKVVSDQGTVTTQGYEYVQSGLTAEAKIREGGRGLVTLALKISLGQITGYVDSAPIQAKDEFQTVAVVAGGGVYLLGALDRDDTRAGSTGLAPQVMTKKTSERRESQVQIWARLYRVGGPVK